MGVTAAHLLSQEGKKVALIERDKIASGDTGYTTAHLTPLMDMGLTAMVKTFGEDGARALWDAGEAAIDQVHEIVAGYGIDCDLSTIPGYLHLPDASDNDGMERLHSDAEVAARLDLPARLIEHTPFFRTLGIRFPNQRRFHPTKYIAGLLKQLEKTDCMVFEDTKAEEFTDDGHTVKAGNFQIHAENVIVATHTPIMGNSGVMSATLFQTKIYPYTSYVIGAEVASHAIPDCLFWDTLDPFHYLRIQNHGNSTIAIYGGGDHKTGQVEDTEAVYADLQRDLERLLNKHDVERKIVSRWSGQVIETNDGAPFIGEIADHQFAGTGFSGNGMTFATLAAMMARDWAMGKKNPWSDLLSPSRKKLFGGTLDYLAENIDFPYYMVRDRLRASEGTSLTELNVGEGKILKLDGERFAVYRDPGGEIVKLSAVCTHLGCLVNWNDADKSWDCPCHGSRFHATGEVMAGPAESALERK